MREIESTTCLAERISRVKTYLEEVTTVRGHVDIVNEARGHVGNAHLDELAHSKAHVLWLKH